MWHWRRVKKGMKKSLFNKQRKLCVCVCTYIHIYGLERSLREGNGDTLQYSCLENPMDRGAWQATAHRVARVRLSHLMAKPTCMYIYIYTHTMEYYSSMWKERMPSKSEREKQIPYDITCMWNLKYGTNERICQTERDSQTRRTDL